MPPPRPPHPEPPSRPFFTTAETPIWTTFAIGCASPASAATRRCQSGDGAGGPVGGGEVSIRGMVTRRIATRGSTAFMPKRRRCRARRWCWSMAITTSNRPNRSICGHRPVRADDPRRQPLRPRGDGRQRPGSDAYAKRGRVAGQRHTVAVAGEVFDRRRRGSRQRRPGGGFAEIADQTRLRLCRDQRQQPVCRRPAGDHLRACAAFWRWKSASTGPIATCTAAVSAAR
jgi:hypothetical protein